MSVHWKYLFHETPCSWIESKVSSLNCEHWTTFQTLHSLGPQKKFFERTWLIKLFDFGSTKSQRQINAANPDVGNKIKTISAFLLRQKHISLFPTAHSIFPSSWLNIFFHKIAYICIFQAFFANVYLATLISSFQSKKLSANNTKGSLFRKHTIS